MVVEETAQVWPRARWSADLVWLLRATVAGRVYRWASRACDPDESGTARHHVGGLDAPQVQTSAPLLSGQIDYPAVSLALWWDDAVALSVEGHELDGAECELSLWAPGTDYADRLVVMRGQAREPERGRAGEPVTLTIDAEPSTSPAALIDEAERIDEQTWPAPEDGSIGWVYPVVIGRAGLVESTGTGTTVPAVPAQRADLAAGGAASGDWVVVARGRLDIAAGAFDKITMWTVTGGTLAASSAAVTPAWDAVGHRITARDYAGTSSATAWYSAWGQFGLGAGVPGIRRDRATAGDCILWALRQSGRAIDYGRTLAAVALLDGYEVAGYVDAPDTDPLSWLADAILPLVPVAIVSGPDGLYPVVYRWHDLSASMAARHIVIGEGIERASTYRAERPQRELRTVSEVRCAWDAYHAAYTVTVRHGHGYDRTSAPAEVAWSRYGERIDAITSTMIYSRRVAGMVAAWRVAALGLPHQIVSVRGGPDLAELRPGHVVTLTDSEAQVSAAVCHVVSVSAPYAGMASVELRVLDRACIL